MTLENVFLLVTWGSAVGLTFYGTLLTHQRVSSRSTRLNNHLRDLHPVSILKPVKGVESGLFENLQSFFQLDYPEYELLFSVASPDDPGVEVIETLIDKNPHVKARLVIGAVEIGLNPKVNNMISTYEQAQYDWILISDSNVRVEPDYLKNMVGHLESGVGMVTSVVTGQNPRGLGGYLEATALNTFYARGMYLAERVGRPCVIGKSMLFKRSTANRFGGVRILAPYLAEDYMAGEAIRKLGLRVVLASTPVQQFIGQFSWKSYWSRQIRWGRIRKNHAPLLFFAEPLLSSLISGMMGALAFQSLINTPLLFFFLAHMVFWWMCDLSLLVRLEPQVPFPRLFLWWLREFLGLPLWVMIAVGNTVHWRGKNLVLQPGGMIEASSMNQARSQ